jgi:hypothetical protein
MSYTITGARQLRAIGEIALLKTDETLWPYTSLHLNLGALGTMAFTEAFTSAMPLPYFLETSQLAPGATQAFAEASALLSGGPETKATKAIRKAFASEVLRSKFRAAAAEPAAAEPAAAEPAVAEPAAAGLQEGLEGYDAGGYADDGYDAGEPLAAPGAPSVALGLPRLRSVAPPAPIVRKVNVASGLAGLR